MPETTVTNTTSVSPSAGIEEIFSATFGYEFSESQSSSNTDSIDIPGGSSGEVTWTPIYECFSGAFSGCANGDPADGSSAMMCGADKGGNGNVRGVVTFLTIA
jgi:hypothetical protein